MMMSDIEKVKSRTKYNEVWLVVLLIIEDFEGLIPNNTSLAHEYRSSGVKSWEESSIRNQGYFDFVLLLSLVLV